MTLEYVLLLALSIFILSGLFHKEYGPVGTFHNSAPRLAARVESDISVGKAFMDGRKGSPTINWSEP